MTKFLLQVVVALSLVIISCVSRRLGIVGGKQSDIKGFPYQGAYLARDKLKCGAIIISELCALTAGELKSYRARYFAHFELVAAN